MIGWLRRLIGGAPRPEPDGLDPPPDPLALPRRARSEAEVAAVEAALAGLLAAGLRLGPRYAALPRREAARRMAEHSEFAVGDDIGDEDLTRRPVENLSLDILWSYRSLADGIEDEFANAALFSDHVYDGADEAAYEGLFRRLLALAGWQHRSVAVSIVQNLGPYGYGFRVTFEAEPPIPPLTFPAAKDFDWRLVERLNACLPAAETRRLRIAADGGTALVLFLGPEEVAEIERSLGWAPGTL